MSTCTLHDTNDLRSVDRQLLMALRSSESLGVGELTDELGVTATAIRQRIDRLLELSLIEREKVVAGRGRPTYRYRLTVLGHQRAGANSNELASALWSEILSLRDTEVRDRLLASVADRLGQRFAQQVDGVGASAQTSDDPADVSPSMTKFEDRVRRLSQVLATHQIETEISHSGELPVLDIGACPYPTMTDTSENRAMCRLEERMFSEALGQPVHLSSCRLDGDACCQFAPVTSAGVTENSTSKPTL